MQDLARENQLDEERLTAFSSGRGEPEWLTRRRTEAWSTFLTAALPDRAQHLWRYSDPAQFEPGGSTAEASAAVVSLSDEARQKGVVAMPLEAAAAHPEHGAQVREHLGQAVGADHGRLEAFALAAWNRGVYLHVPRGVELAVPLRVEFSSPADALDVRRVLMIVEEGSRATLIEQHGDGKADDPARCWGVGEIFVADNARVDHVLLQTLGAGVNAHLTQRIVLARSARAHASLVSFGGKSSKVDTGTLLAGEGSEVETIGLLYGRKKQFFDHHTVHHHSAPHTSSQLDFKVVLSGRSHSAYTGNITIEKKAPFSSAFQENRNLLLSERARAESIPELEIDIDEVQCSHGATIGPIREDELFYLMSRGIPEREAVRQIVRGFLETILEKIPEDLQEPLRVELDARLEEIQDTVGRDRGQQRKSR